MSMGCHRVDGAGYVEDNDTRDYPTPSVSSDGKQQHLISSKSYNHFHTICMRGVEL